MLFSSNKEPLQAEAERTILITGATGGIGKLLSRAFATKFNSLILTGRNRDALKKLEQELESLCKKVTCIPCDLSNEQELQALTSCAENVSVFIHCAAEFGETQSVCNSTPEGIRHAFQVNFLAPTLLLQKNLPFMIKRSYGRVIILGSVAGLQGHSLRLPYAVSKHSLIALTKTLNDEIRGGEYGEVKDVKVFCLCPGPIRGDRAKKQLYDRAAYKHITPQQMQHSLGTVFGRVLEPEEIVACIKRLTDSSISSFSNEIITFN